MSRLALLTLALTACTKPLAELGPREPSGARQVTVLYVADLHGQLEEHPELFWQGGDERIETAGGFARLKTAVDRIRAERDGEVLFLDAGDTLQGSGAAALTQGEAMIAPLNLLGLDAGVPGNWEVVYGAEVLVQRAAALDHPLFAANLHTDDGTALFPRWFVKEVGGVRVGVLGYTDPDVPQRQPPAYSRGLAYTGPEALPGLVEELKREEQVDVVLLMSHIGLSKAVALTRDVPGIDAHLSSDTHERTYQPIDVDGTWVVEPGAFGSFLGRLDLWVQDGRVVDRRWELIELTAEAFPPDPVVAEAVARELAPHREVLDRVIGHTEVPLARYAVVETPMDAWLSDVLRDATGTDIALSNGFRFGTPLTPGPIRESDLWNLFPIVTPLKTGKVTGEQLRAFWERELENVFAADPSKRFGGWVPRPSGMELVFDARAPKGERVREIRIGGEPLEDERVYTLTACEREGDLPDTLCRIPGVAEPRVLDFDAHDAVRRWLDEHGPIRALPESGRVRATDLPPVLRTQN